MVIQIDGGASTNKGGQLMLVAVIQEIKNRFPDAQVFENDIRPDEALLKQQFGSNYRLPRSKALQNVITSLKMEKLAYLFVKKFWHRYSIFRAKKGIDIVLNIGGFQFGDQWNHSWYDISMWRRYLARLKKYNTKTVFLPQAFGPFKKEGSRKMLKVLNQYADLLIARDDESYNYLISGGIDKQRIALFPDFTSPVKGVKTEHVSQSIGKVCIIPNNKMIKQNILQEDDYIKAISTIIEHVEGKGYKALLLNHEGAPDYRLCQKIASTRTDLPIVTGLNAIETKGVVAASYVVISSRYHGVANALSSGVPCLATSWSHKYQKLLDEYGQGDCLIDLTDMKSTLVKLDRLLDKNENTSRRETLEKETSQVIAKNNEMWNYVWDSALSTRSFTD